jgi:acetyl-CoA carboxylase biotin carboxylase subunit
MFTKILIANRGEIAVRIMRTCREMGISTVAIYSDADSRSLHVLSADQAVYLGEAEPSKSYLNIDKIINAAKSTGAEAIHPGYGFLAENADFAERCKSSGLTFIGPPPQVIRDLGDKITARKIMTAGGVPVIPGTMECIDNIAAVAADAERIGYPVLVKAAAGGGGKGMRVVDNPEDLGEACNASSSEAAGAFGDGSIFIEKYLSPSRHVEFQILADSYGNVIHLNERECSIQRRHQKVIEETPSPIMTPELKEKMGAAAVAAARASGYCNAGTVEFIVDCHGNFFFLEVNTRLQVEHPVTEMTTGIDLVRYQISIAAGEKLSLAQEDISAKGHAIECRIYAEDPEEGFFPSPGTIHYMKEPSGPGIRNDCGVYTGCTVPFEYDPIVSKLVVHGNTRQDAISRMIRALQEYIILGIKTPVPFLIDVLKSEPFLNGETYTDFIDTHFRDWSMDRKNLHTARIAFLVDEMLPAKQQVSRGNGILSSRSPWQTLGNWRL